MPYRNWHRLWISYLGANWLPKSKPVWVQITSCYKPTSSNLSFFTCIFFVVLEPRACLLNRISLLFAMYRHYMKTICVPRFEDNLSGLPVVHSLKIGAEWKIITHPVELYHRLCSFWLNKRCVINRIVSLGHCNSMSPMNNSLPSGRFDWSYRYVFLEPMAGNNGCGNWWNCPQTTVKGP